MNAYKQHILMQPPIRVLFVCLGNICRSPLAEGVFGKLIEERDLTEYFDIDSAGTGGWHVGESPDDRMQATARDHGIELGHQSARRVIPADLEEYDHILVMDKKNQRRMSQIDGFQAHSEKIRLFRSFDPEPGDMEVPDPYFGGEDGFEHVYRIVERTADRLLDELIEEHDMSVDRTS
jgi:protein-tyrosine phosphatase